MNGTRPQPGVIQQFASDVAVLVAAEHAGDPLGELTVWLQMALRREASVGQMYDVTNLERRLALVRCPRAHIELVRVTFSNIWAQEKGHAAYLEAMLAAVVRRRGVLPWLSSRVDAVLGSLEGQLLSARTSPGLGQKLKSTVMLRAGKLVQDVPDFVAALTALPFRDFCLLNAELEVTAIHGYQRMLALLELLGDHSFMRDTTFKADLTHFVRDEQFHNQTFLAMDAWFAPASTSPNARLGGHEAPLLPRLSIEACRAELAAIRATVYGEPRPAPAAPVPAPVVEGGAAAAPAKAVKPRAARAARKPRTSPAPLEAPSPNGGPVIRLVRKPARTTER
jgi:hypothetical protein